VCLALALAVSAAAVPFAVPVHAKTGTEPGDEVPVFEADLITPKGNKKFHSNKQKMPTAFVFIGCRCGGTNAYAPRMKDLAAAYGKLVQFVFVYPNRSDSAADQEAFHRSYGVTSARIDDRGAKIAQLLGVARTSELILVDKKGRLAYRGSLDDSRNDPAMITKHYAKTAIEEVLAGKAVTTPKTAVFG
jgi:hypothetical protein